MDSQPFNSGFGDRVSMPKEAPNHSPEPKMGLAMNNALNSERDAEAYARGTRETIASDQGFIQLPPTESIRETLEYIPAGLFAKD